MNLCGSSREEANPAGCDDARAYFPRGLLQPPGSFRFSADALLLASFPRLRHGQRVLDLGTGCGVVALGMLCRAHGSGVSLVARGIDIQAELVAAAHENARRLGFSHLFAASVADLEQGAFLSRSGSYVCSPAGLAAASYDYVVANPPYRRRDQGRLPASPSRLTALFETPGTLGIFCRSAALALAAGGRFAILYPAARLEELVAALARERLFPVRELPLAPRGNRPPSLVLVEAALCSQGQAPSLCVREPALILHEQESGGYSRQALAFCPFLACNARR